MKNDIKYFILNYELRTGYYVIQSDGGIVSTRSRCNAKFLKQTVLPTGYLQVSIMNKGKCKSKLVHRLIAQAFIPNPENKPCVNHKDGNKLNNDVSNLEWCTYSENELHSYSVLGKINSSPGTGKLGSLNAMSKPVISFKNGDKRYFESISMAAKALNIFGSNISKVLKGKYKHSGGYTFTYV
jgi:hypothetical protein